MPKGYAEMRAAARSYTDAALETLVRNLKSKTLGVQAATAILNRGWGMPSQPHSGEGGEGPVRYLVKWVVTREMPPLQEPELKPANLPGETSK
jgi:hypothetical protein